MSALRRSSLRCLSILCILGMLLPGGRLTAQAPSPGEHPLAAASAPQGVAPARSFGQLPLYFVENQGQVDSQVAYYIQGRDKTIYFSSEGVTFVLSGPTEENTLKEQARSDARVRASLLGQRLPAAQRQRWVVKLDFLGANPGVTPQGLDRTEAVISYFRGPRETWHAGLPTYTRIVYRELWPGIDLLYYGTVGQLKYEFVVHPGADPGQIRMAYRGATAVTPDGSGGVRVSTPLGSFADQTPVAYQRDPDGKHVPVRTAFAVQGAGAGPAEGRAISVGFHLGQYDTMRPLVIDPAITVYCGYIGGDGDDVGFGIAVDGAGNAYLAGITASSEESLPVAVGPDLTYNGQADVFVAKVNAAGTALLYWAYIGGSFEDYSYSIAVDGTGNAYVAGDTYSSEDSFPVTVGPDLTFNGGNYDAFVAKVNATGTALDYCGYIGGDADDGGYGIAVDGAGNAYVAGTTYSSGESFPVAVGPDLSDNGGLDAFVAEVKADGTSLLYCGYIGGGGDDVGYSIAIDGAGNAYVAGGTDSSGDTFPVAVGPDLTYNGGPDAFVAKVNAAGTALDYCGYIGGNNSDAGIRLAVDGAANAYITGWTGSAQDTFPVAVGPDLTYHAEVDAFVAKVNAAGMALDYCGYIGGDGLELGTGIAVDAAGEAYITGWTFSAQDTFPVTVGPDLTYNGGGDAFVARVNAAGTAFDYCGYIGGDSSELGIGVAVDDAGDAYVCGITDSSESTFPVTVGPDLTYNGGEDAFVAKIETVPSIVVTADPVALVAGSAGSSTLRATVRDWQGRPVAGQSVSFATTLGTLSSATATTDASGVATVTLTTGATAGDAVVTASVGALVDSATVILTAAPNQVVAPPPDGEVTTSDGALTIAAPSSGQALTIVYTPMSAPAPDPGTIEGAGLTFQLDAIDAQGDAVQVPSAPLELTLHYNPADLPLGVDEMTLEVRRRVDATTWAPLQVLRRDMVAHTITVLLDHFSEYAIWWLKNISVGAIIAPLAPVPLAAGISASATFEDLSVGDTHTAAWAWGDGSQSAGTVSETAKTVVGSHTYGASGVYRVLLTVTDSTGLWASSSFEYAVVYDPDGGYVTGGGWINSPAGAYAANPTLTGKADFGFVSMYRKGAITPTGNTEFQFKVANLNFHSESYEWLVVAGAKAKYKGTGIINGAGNYGFMLSAIDGQINGGGGVDRFRIKIWDKDNNDIVIYDNELGVADDADPTTVIGGGSILVHRAK